MTQPPLAWIKEIHNTLIDAKAIPLSGSTLTFPWEDLAKKIAEILHAPECTLALRQTKILEEAEITSGLGADCLFLTLELTPLRQQAFWIMGKGEVAKLTALALVTSSGSNKGFSSSQFQEGFYSYLATKALLALDELNVLSNLPVKLGKPAPLPAGEALCFDVEIHLFKHTFWGRFVCPAALHETLKAHVESAEQPLSLNTPLAKQLTVTASLNLGHTLLSLSQWQKLSVGDCILLDTCSFDPSTHKGTATLMLEGMPILRVRIKGSSVKIVDYATYHQEQPAMTTDIPEEESTESQEESNEQENHLWSVPNGEIEKRVSSKEIPLMLHVEVARLNISLEKLLQLTPGNVLELPVRPEQGVDLLIGGKKVARAELVKLGEMLGVKILQIASLEV